MARVLLGVLLALFIGAELAGAQTCSFTCINGQPTQPAGPPQGRLTLANGVPVMATDQTAATTIYYTPYNGNLVPIYNGSAFLATPFSQLSNITTNSSTGNAGPAAVTTNSNYDLFVWSNGGTVTLTRGPAWSSDTDRGTGAGTSELQRVNGIWTNAVTITNGPGADLGTYVGSVHSDGSSQINWVMGSAGTSAVLAVWNAYNRVDVLGFVGDSNPSWSYSSGSWRAARGSNTVRVSFIQGLSEDGFRAEYVASANTGGQGYVGLGHNSTSTPAGQKSWTGTSTPNMLPSSHQVIQYGWGFLQALEQANGTDSVTFYGNNGGASLQTGLTYRGRF